MPLESLDRSACGWPGKIRIYQDQAQRYVAGATRNQWKLLDRPSVQRPSYQVLRQPGIRKARLNRGE